MTDFISKICDPGARENDAVLRAEPKRKRKVNNRYVVTYSQLERDELLQWAGGSKSVTAARVNEIIRRRLGHV
jgi:hypothetical protein